MSRVLPLMVALMVMVIALPVGAVDAPAPSQRQSDRVTLTVSVQTPTGTPVSDADLTARWEGGATSETTAANGKAFLDVPAGADVTLTVSHPEYIRNEPYRIRNATERSVDITAYRRTTARFAIADTAGPVANASVTLAKQDRGVLNATTNETGVVATGVIEAGNYTLTIEKQGYIPRQRMVHLSGVERRSLTIQRAATLLVTVSDDTPIPPTPIVGANVTVTGIDASFTGENGTVRLDQVPANTTLEVTITKPGYMSTTREITVRNRTRTLNATVRRTPNLSLEFLNRRVVVGERLLVTVTDEYDRPVSNATILIDGEQGAQTGSDGTARVRLDAAGNHTVEARTGLRASRARIVTGVPDLTGPARRSPPTETRGGPTPTSTPVADANGEGAVPVLGGLSLPSIGVGVLIGVVLVLAAVGVRRSVGTSPRKGL